MMMSFSCLIFYKKSFNYFTCLFVSNALSPKHFSIKYINKYSQKKASNVGQTETSEDRTTH